MGLIFLDLKDRLEPSETEWMLFCISKLFGRLLASFIVVMLIPQKKVLPYKTE